MPKKITPYSVGRLAGGGVVGSGGFSGGDAHGGSGSGKIGGGKRAPRLYAGRGGPFSVLANNASAAPQQPAEAGDAEVEVPVPDPEARAADLDDEVRAVRRLLEAAATTAPAAMVNGKPIQSQVLENGFALWSTSACE